MKILLMFLVLNGQTGDLDGFVMGGPVENVVACHDQGRKLFDKIVNEPSWPKGEVAWPLCIDVSKVPLNGKDPLPASSPTTKL